MIAASLLGIEVTLADLALALLWVGVTAYALFAGADFGAGFWDLLAGGDEGGAPMRARIEHSIGPVWEANHVWLIFVLVTTWTAFPQVFASIASTLYIPLTLAAFGVIFRGSAFAFRKSVTHLASKRLFGATFALSSVLTPFAFGTAAGAIASGRVPEGIAAGSALRSWINPTSILGGVLAVGTCSFLAAVYLAGDARRAGEADISEQFRRRALVSGVVVGVIALAGIVVLHQDAPRLFAGLTGRGAPLVAISAVGGVGTLALLWRRAFTLARPAAGLAVIAVIWGWGAGQYPLMLGTAVDVHAAAAPSSTLGPMVVVLGVGALLFVPPLIALFVMAQRATGPPSPTEPGRSAR